jgi:rod shape-determining protein MreC
VLSFLQRHKGLVVVGVLLVLPAIMLIAQTRRVGSRGPVVGVILDVGGVVERGLLWATGGLMDAIEHYVTSVDSYDELVRLRRERVAVDVLDARVAELSIENERLRALANAAGTVSGPRPVGARVIGRTGAPLAHLVSIDKGSAHGLRRGDGVISVDGVVGVVLAVGRAHADVLTLTDPAAAIDVLVQRSRARGVLRGLGADDKYAAIVEDFDRLRDVQPGDPVVTGGIGARFPPGLLVGSVVDVDDRDDLTLRAVIRPAVDVARLEHVAVLIQREALAAPTIADDTTAVPPPIRRVKRKPRVRPEGAPESVGDPQATDDGDDAVEPGLDAGPAPPPAPPPEPPPAEPPPPPPEPPPPPTTPEPPPPPPTETPAGTTPATGGTPP